MSNEKQTAVQNLCMKLANKLGMPQAITFYVDHKQLLLEALEMEKEQSQNYAEFCVRCDRENLPLLDFESYILTYGGNK
jgi:hypothetical protein